MSERARAMAVTMTEEEREVLAKTRLDAIYQRSLPIMAINGFVLYQAFQRGFMSKSPIIAKAFVTGTVSTVSFFIGIASFGNEFRRRLDALDESPLREKMDRNQRGSDRFGYSNIPHGAVYTPYPDGQGQTNQRRDNTQGSADGFRDYDRSRDPSFHLDNRDSENRYRLSPETPTHPNLPNQYPSSVNEPPTGNQKYMSYPERRIYYRNNPGLPGQIDPFAKPDKRRPSLPIKSDAPDTDPIRTQPLTERDVGSEKPFIPFFDETSSGQSKW